jgi:cysteinyl-tRNA synthetase
VTNIVDLADRSIRGAERTNTDLSTYTSRCTEAFLRDIDKLRIKRDEVYPKASEHVDDMIRMAEKLVGKGYAYEKLRSVYFDISKFNDYGKLSNVDLSKVQHGGTVDLDDYEKDSPVDFALLKRSTLSELKKGVYFKTRWGSVRPSWHLECAAISLKYLGEAFDIHASGADITFPHCENVLAIGKAATGKGMANYWLNTELVMIDGKKMSRSLGNVLTMEDLENRGCQGREVRFFLLGSHYRKPLNFSWGAMETAKNTVRKLNHFIQRLIRFTPGDGFSDTDQYLYDVKQGFTSALDDDLNISGALASLFDFINKVSIPLARGQFRQKERDSILEAMTGLDSVLGIMHFEEETISDEILQLLEERTVMRKEKRWQEADAIRGKLAALGIDVYDTPQGSFWRHG